MFINNWEVINDWKNVICIKVDSFEFFKLYGVIKIITTNFLYVFSVIWIKVWAVKLATNYNFCWLFGLSVKNAKKFIFEVSQLWDETWKNIFLFGVKDFLFCLLIFTEFFFIENISCLNFSMSFVVKFRFVCTVFVFLSNCFFRLFGNFRAY